MLMIKTISTIMFPQNNFLQIVLMLLLPDFLCRFFIQHFSSKNLLVIEKHWINFFPYLTVRTLSVRCRLIHQRLRTQQYCYSHNDVNAFIFIFPRIVSWKLTNEAMWNTREMWLDIRSPRCSADNPSPTLAISLSTNVTFMSLSFDMDAKTHKGLNCFELSLILG